MVIMIEELKRALESQVSHLSEFDDCGAEDLEEMANDWLEEVHSPNPDRWLAEVFPYEGPPPPVDWAAQWTLQKLFRYNPQRALREILMGGVADEPAPRPKQNAAKRMFKEWKHLAKVSVPSQMPVNKPGSVWNVPLPTETAMRHVNAYEVRDTDQNVFGAAGPDSVTLSEWEELPPVVRAVYFNLVLANGCFSKKALRHRAVFLGGSSDDSDFFEYASVPNVAVRQLHRIFLTRLKNEMEVVNRRQFNLMLLGSLHHEKRSFFMVKVSFYRAYATLIQDAVYHTLRQAGALHLAQYLFSTYNRVTLYFTHGNPVRMERGIPLGDPLSETILTMVMDQLVASISNSGVSIGGSNLYALVCGDEVLLLGTAQETLQRAASTLEAAAKNVGLVVDPGKCRAAGAFCQPPFICLGGQVVTQMVDGEYWWCFGRLFNGGRFLSPVKVLREYTEAICDAELDSDQLLDALKQMIDEYVGAEVFFTAPSLGELRTIDQDIFETACWILDQEEDWDTIFGTKDECCYGLRAMEDRAPEILKRALEELDEWYKYGRKNSLLNLATSYLKNSLWYNQCLQLASLYESDCEDESDEEEEYYY